MTTQHTPGPWRTIINCQDYEGQPYLIYAGAEPVATIDRGIEDEANAALIEAAPDILEAAAALLAKIDHITTKEFELGAEKAEREALRAAIEKATQP